MDRASWPPPEKAPSGGRKAHAASRKGNGSMTDAAWKPAQCLLDGEDVRGDYVPDDFLLQEGDLQDGLA